MREGRGWFDGAARTGSRAGEWALVRGVLAVEVARGSGGSCAREMGIEEMGSGKGLVLPSPCVTALGRDKTNEGRVRRSDGAG